MIAQEGDDTNCFVSLVVDTRGTYVAIVTRKVIVKSEVSVKKLSSSYEFFGDGTQQQDANDEVNTKTVEKSYIEYFSLEIERHTIEESTLDSLGLSYLDDRFEVIKAKKEAARPKISFSSPWQSWDLERAERPTLYRQQSLWDDETLKSLERHSEVKDIQIDEEQIHNAVVTILSCSFIVDPKKFDVKQWVKRHLNKVYDKTFGNPNTAAFQSWAEFIISYTLDNIDVIDVPDIYADFDSYYSPIAEALYEELSKYYDDSPYIQYYCNSLLNYM